MFRCTECNKEYDIKPGYCDDCGNDTFEEIENPKEEQIPEEKNDVKFEKFEEKQDFTPVKENLKPEDILSYIIFGTCLFLSIVIVFFINPKFEEKPVTPKKEEKTDIKIPPIDSFWNNELPKNTQISKTEEVQEPPKQEPKTTVVPLKFEPLKKTEKPAQQVKQVSKQPVKPSSVQPPVQNTKVQNQQPLKQPTTQTSKQPAAQNTKQTPTQPKQQQTTTAKTQTQPKQTQTNTANNQTNNNIQVPVWQQTQQIQPAQPVQTTQQQPAAQKTSTSTASSQSLSSYKSSLRNKIGRAIDFAEVIGDGTCTLSFKIASNGKLTDRKFVKQSTNSTLNDAVYKAIMQVPAFNTPPESYKGETMQLVIKFYNGNFEISLN